MKTKAFLVAGSLAASLWASTALADGVVLRALMEDVPETKIIEAYDFFKAIAEGGTVSPNFADGYQISLIDDAIVESAASGNWVEVPLIES